MPVASVYREGKKNFSIFCTVVKIVLSLHRIKGVLAHLARARHWQCRGERFESAILHIVICFFLRYNSLFPGKTGFLFFYGVSKDIIQSNRGNHIVSVECGLQLLYAFAVLFIELFFICMFIMLLCVSDKTTWTVCTWSCVIFRVYSSPSPPETIVSGERGRGKFHSNF